MDILTDMASMDWQLGLSSQIPNRPYTNKFKDPISPKRTRADTKIQNRINVNKNIVLQK